MSPAERIRHGVVACKTGTAEFGGADEQGRRRTHAWFGMTVGGIDELIQADLQEAIEPVATASALITDEKTLDLQQERQHWLAKVKTAGFPKILVILVLVESDEEKLFTEGSADAAPIARQIVNWLVGRNTP